MVSRKHIHQNSPHDLLSRLFGDFKLIKGFDFLESGEELNEHETMRRDLTRMMATVDDIRSSCLTHCPHKSDCQR